MPFASPLLHMHAGQHRPSGASWTTGNKKAIIIIVSYSLPASLKQYQCFYLTTWTRLVSLHRLDWDVLKRQMPAGITAARFRILGLSESARCCRLIQSTPPSPMQGGPGSKGPRGDRGDRGVSVSSVTCHYFSLQPH